MTKRSKNNSKMWNTNIATLITEMPESIEIKNRYRAIRFLLLKVYPQLNEIPKETLLSILKDTEYISRQLRLFNEGNEHDLKKELVAEKLTEIYD